ncbi:MAG: RagB/SusD family nutrient uptake outer membrane protein [Odoribacter sp.]
MKIYLTFLISSLLLMSSCDSYLNLKPKNKTVVGTMEDVKLMMSSYLFSMSASSSYPISFNRTTMTWPFNRDALACFAHYSDDVKMSLAVRNHYGKKYEKEYYENVDWKGWMFSELMWKRMYLHIGYLNSVLKSLSELSEYDQAEFERVKGEALTIRAYFIFKLLQYYAPYKNNELGIPLNLDPEVIDGPKRLTQKACYSQILGDLNEALGYEGQETAWNVFYSKNVLYALLAQVYQFKAESAAGESGDWENAEKYSSFIVDKYRLETSTAEIKQMFSPADGGVFYKDNNFALRIFGWNITPRSNTSAFWGYVGAGQYPADDLLTSYDAGDIRYEAWFDTEEKEYNKYTYKTWVIADYVVLFRVADMYLICAEANARLNRDKGKILLETFKKSRIPGFTSLTGGNVLDEVMLERRKEFCCEYDMRWLDMKRMGYTITREGVNEKSQQVNTYTLRGDDYRYALPIPIESELTYNKIEQNPGWN